MGLLPFADWVISAELQDLISTMNEPSSLEVWKAFSVIHVDFRNLCAASLDEAERFAIEVDIDTDDGTVVVLAKVRKLKILTFLPIDRVIGPISGVPLAENMTRVKGYIWAPGRLVLIFDLK